MARIVEDYASLSFPPTCMCALDDGGLAVASVGGSVYYYFPNIIDPLHPNNCTIMGKMKDSRREEHPGRYMPINDAMDYIPLQITSMVQLRTSVHEDSPVLLLCANNLGELYVIAWDPSNRGQEARFLHVTVNSAKPDLALTGDIQLCRSDRNDALYACDSLNRLVLLDSFRQSDRGAFACDLSVMYIQRDYPHPLDHTRQIRVAQINKLAWLHNSGLLICDSKSRIIHLLPRNSLSTTLFAGTPTSDAELFFVMHQHIGQQPIDGPAWSKGRFHAVINAATRNGRVFVCDSGSLRRVEQVDGRIEPEITTHAGRLVMGDATLAGNGEAIRQAAFYRPLFIGVDERRIYVIEEKGALAERCIRCVRDVSLIDILLSRMSAADLLVIYQHVKQGHPDLALLLLRRMVVNAESADRHWQSVKQRRSTFIFDCNKLSPHIAKYYNI